MGGHWGAGGPQRAAVQRPRTPVPWGTGRRVPAAPGLTLWPPPSALRGRALRVERGGRGPGPGLRPLRGHGLENAAAGCRGTRAGRPQGWTFGCTSLKSPARPAAVSLREGHAAPEGVSVWKSHLPLTRRRFPCETPSSRRPQALGTAHGQLGRPELPEVPARPARGSVRGPSPRA